MVGGQSKDAGDKQEEQEKGEKNLPFPFPNHKPKVASLVTRYVDPSITSKQVSFLTICEITDSLDCEKL